MKVNEKLVTEISTEMKLKFTAEETTTLVKELNQTLEMFAALNEVDTTNVEGSFYGGLGAASFREDIAVASPEQVKAMLKQAKTTKDSFIEVPAILDDGEAGA